MENVHAIQSRANLKYLSYVHDDSPQRRYLQASAPDENNIYVKVRLHSSKSVEGMVNIESVCVHKFWVPIHVTDTWWVVAQAEAPNEQVDSPKCTLFEIRKVDNTTVRIHHPNLDRFLCLKDASPQHPDCAALIPDGQNTDGKDHFTLIK